MSELKWLKSDIHLHSKHSKQPAQWLLRRMGTQESYITPREIYRKAKDRGMDLVTITDHNTIDGCLEIAHKEDVFTSAEITSAFPEYDCKVHLLVYGIDEKIIKECIWHSENIYDLREYVLKNNIIHCLAHPLYSVNEKLSLEVIEKLLVLFNTFEGLNGGRVGSTNDLFCNIVKRLNKKIIDDLANKYDIAPHGEEPWVKNLTAGSDDHSGISIAQAWTKCKCDGTVEGFLNEMRNQRTDFDGLHGTVLNLAHSIYRITYHFYKWNFYKDREHKGDVVIDVLQDWFGKEVTSSIIEENGENSQGQKTEKLSEEDRTRISKSIKELYKRGRKDPNLLKEEEEARDIMLQDLLGFMDGNWYPDGAEEIKDKHEVVSKLAGRVAGLLIYQFTNEFVEKISKGSLFGSIQAISAIIPVLMGISPYLFSYHHQYRDRKVLDEVAKTFGVLNRDEVKRAWFTDTALEDNAGGGVAATVRYASKVAEENDWFLKIIHCNTESSYKSNNVECFQPIGEIPLPEYEMLKVGFPPFVKILDYCERNEIRKIIISTPGPVGLCGIGASKLLEIPKVGIYHTDIPRFIRYFTEDETIGRFADRYMKWFYGLMDAVFVLSDHYKKQLIDMGILPEKIHIFPKGTDIELFHPSKKVKDFWLSYDKNPEIAFRFIYVGRVSKEKSLDDLIAAFRIVKQKYPETGLSIVGDGPYFDELEEKAKSDDIIFTGFIEGETLAQSFASSDLFVFPSTSDTYGSVILEAMASDIPVIVTDIGGPCEVVKKCDAGIIIEAFKPEILAEAMEKLYIDKKYYNLLKSRARPFAETKSWKNALTEFWKMLDEVC